MPNAKGAFVGEQSSDLSPTPVGDGAISGGAPDPQSVAPLVVTDIPQELERAALPEVDATMRAAVLEWDGRGPPGGGTVIVDLSEVNFIDSAGVACLLSWQRQACDVGLEVYVRNPRPIVAKVFGILQVTDHLLWNGSSDGESST
jgi:anti-anti-sigma factor